MQKIHPFDLPEVTGDIALNSLFPHQSLPHYVWIDGTGTVCAITEAKDVSADNIKKMLCGEQAALQVKNDLKIPYNSDQLLFFNGNGGNGEGVVYHSVLSAYVPGLKGGNTITSFDPIKGQKFNSRNTDLLWLYRLAFLDEQWFPRSQMQILSKDSLKMTSKLKGKAFLDWLAAGNGRCYELQVPPDLATQAFDIIRTDLKRFLPAYTASVETQTVKCLALVRTSASDKLQTKATTREVTISPFSCHLRNAPLKTLLQRLSTQYLQNSPIPVVDATGYSGPVDLDLNAQLSNVADLNKALAEYDLKFIEQDAPVKVLVIRDTPGYTPKIKHNLP